MSTNLKRWNGSEFMPGGTLRRWDGADWEPPLALTPADLGAVLWLDTDNLSGLAEGDGVAAWAGHIGPTMTPPVAPPLYSAAGMDGLPGVAFSASRWLTTHDAALDLGDAFTACVVLRTNPGNGDGMAWMFGQEGALVRRALWCHGTSETNFSGYNSNVQTGASNGARCLISIRRSSDGSVIIKKNGSVVGAGSPGLAPYSYEGFALGANVSGSETYTGVIGAVAAFTEALSDTDLALLEDAWLARYAI